MEARHFGVLGTPLWCTLPGCVNVYVDPLYLCVATLVVTCRRTRTPNALKSNYLDTHRVRACCARMVGSLGTLVYTPRASL